MGFGLEVDARLTAELNRPHVPLAGQMSGIPGYPCYRTVQEAYAAAAALAAAHPQLATWIDVGDSWERTQDPTQGHDLMVLRLTNAAVSGPKPRLFVIGSIHAREYAPAEEAWVAHFYGVGNESFSGSRGPQKAICPARA